MKKLYLTALGALMSFGVSAQTYDVQELDNGCGPVRYVVNYNPDQTVTFTLVNSQGVLTKEGLNMGSGLIDITGDGGLKGILGSRTYTTTAKYEPGKTIQFNWYFVYAGGVAQKMCNWTIPDQPNGEVKYACCLTGAKPTDTSISLDYEFMNVTNVEHTPSTAEIFLDIDWNGADWGEKPDLQQFKQTALKGTYTITGLPKAASFNIYPKGNVDGVTMVGNDQPFTTSTLGGSSVDPNPGSKTNPTVNYAGEHTFKAVAGHDDWAELTFKYTVTNPDNVVIKSIRFAAAGAPGDAVAGVEYGKWNNGDIIWGEVTVTEGIVTGENTATIIVKNLNKGRDNNCWMKSRVTIEGSDYEGGGAGAWPVNPTTLSGGEIVNPDKKDPVVEYTGDHNFTGVEGHDDWAQLTFKYTVTNPDNVAIKSIRFAAAGAVAEGVPGILYDKWSNGDIIWGEVTVTEGIVAGENTATMIIKNLNPEKINNCYMKSHIVIEGKEYDGGNAGSWPVNPSELTVGGGGDDDLTGPKGKYVHHEEFNVRAAVLDENGDVVWTYAIDKPEGIEIAGTSGDYYKIVSTPGQTKKIFAPNFKFTIGNTVEGHVQGFIDFILDEKAYPEGMVIRARLNNGEYQSLNLNKLADGTRRAEFATNFAYREDRVVSFVFNIAYAYHDIYTKTFTYTITDATNATKAKDFKDFVRYTDGDTREGAYMKYGVINTAGVTEHSDTPVGDWEAIARPVDDLDATPWNPTHQYLFSNPVTKDDASQVAVTCTFELDNGTKLPADYEPKLVIYELDEDGNPVMETGEDGELHRKVLYGPTKMNSVPEVVNMFTLNTGDAKFPHNKKIGFAINHSFTSIRSGKGNSKTAIVPYTVNTVEPYDAPITGVDDITVSEGADVEVEYYNLQGVRVSADNLPAGIYIRRTGKTVTKVLVK